MRLTEGGPGDPPSSAIAEAMVQAGQAAGRRLGYAGGYELDCASWKRRPSRLVRGHSAW